MIDEAFMLGCIDECMCAFLCFLLFKVLLHICEIEGKITQFPFAIINLFRPLESLPGHGYRGELTTEKICISVFNIQKKCILIKPTSSVVMKDEDF